MKKIKQKKNKFFINSVLSLIVGISTVTIMNMPARARTVQEISSEIESLQSQIDDANKKASELKKAGDTLQAELDSISKQKTAIEAQIQISKAQYEKLHIEIENTQKSIEDNRKALGLILANMSIEEDITPIERLASSENISKALDNLEYQSSVKDSLVKKVKEIKKQKKNLEEKRDLTKKVLADQEVAEKQLRSKIAEQNKLIESTRGEESEYKKYAESQNAQVKALQNEQNRIIQEQARRQARSSSSVDLGSTGVGSSYAWGSSWGCVVDQATAWSYKDDPLGYGCAQCVSYTAWRILKETGYRAAWWGNANMWPASARRNGFSTGRTPRAGSIAVMYVGQYGHVAWVEAVHGDGTMTISQYNWPTKSNGYRWGEYSQMRISTGQFHEYIYIK